MQITHFSAQAQRVPTNCARNYWLVIHQHGSSEETEVKKLDTMIYLGKIVEYWCTLV